jgi:hypothetical protein
MGYLTPGGEAVLRSLPADAAIRNIPVAPRPPTFGGGAPPVAPPLAAGGAAAAGGGVAGGAAAGSSAASFAGAVAAGVLAFGAGFAVGDSIAQSLGIEYPGGKNAFQFFFGGRDPGIGATGATDAPLTINYEGDPPFEGGQMAGVTYAVNLFRQLPGGPSYFNQLYPRGPVQFLRVVATSEFGRQMQAMGSNGLQTQNVDILVGEPDPVFGPLFRLDGQPDTGGNPAGTIETATVGRRFGAPWPTSTTAPTTTPTTTPTIAPPAPATPGQPVNPPNDERDPLLPPWVYMVPWAMKAGAPAAGLSGSPARGPNVIQVNNPAPDSGAGNSPPPTKNKTTNDCRCNIPLFNKVDALDKKLENVLGGAGLAADGGILAKLNQMQGYAEKAWQSTQVQKVIDAMTLITVLHNASMISRDVGETLGFALSQALDVLGIDDEEGNALDVNGWFGTQANSFFQNLFGAETWAGLNETWNKANRIISSATMIVWTLRSIHDGTQEVLEWTAENTGKIGNALKKWGVVGERAYPWMAERVKAQDAYRRKFSRILDGLEAAENTASSYAMVTSEINEISQEIGELGEQRQRFAESVRDMVPDSYPDNSEFLGPNEQAGSNARSGPAVTPADMEPASDGAS